MWQGADNQPVEQMTGRREDAARAARVDTPYENRTVPRGAHSGCLEKHQFGPGVARVRTDRRFP